MKDSIKPLNPDLQNYALNRWLNFWSAKGVEQIFALDKRVVPNLNSYDKLTDFTIDNIPFDHKTSVFPKGLNQTLNEAMANKNQTIRWFYENQSQEGRKHYKNRIFIVLFSNNNEHWKLKTEIGLLKTHIEDYLNNFAVEKLEKITFGQEQILADIIWVVK
ncbi:conserved hypothetical protein [Capnocytophaga canimorsus]|nr:hypothetical protein [Capnocytophaga canimorsus]CEN50441.1 conserved hypothetical protein [Capnocytophaga canimorsus]